MNGITTTRQNTTVPQMAIRGIVSNSRNSLSSYLIGKFVKSEHERLTEDVRQDRCQAANTWD